jgi:SAM-dependent methyltransferase
MRRSRAPRSPWYSGQVRGRARLNRLTGGRLSALEGTVGVGGAGHRGYVGGRWEEIGRLQREFMVSRGLRPDHVFLDIACGSLRGGIHLIPYLDRGNYLGIDKEGSLIKQGLARELPRRVRREKRPEFVVSDGFEFGRFSKQPNFSLAQSLFTHLVVTEIDLCLANLRASVAENHESYTTFYLGDSDGNPSESNDQQGFSYSPDQLAAIGRRNGWLSDYIGEWGHPRGQVMMRFVAQ